MPTRQIQRQETKGSLVIYVRVNDGMKFEVNSSNRLAKQFLISRLALRIGALVHSWDENVMRTLRDFILSISNIAACFGWGSNILSTSQPSTGYQTSLADDEEGPDEAELNENFRVSGKYLPPPEINCDVVSIKIVDEEGQDDYLKDLASNNEYFNAASGLDISGVQAEYSCLAQHFSLKNLCNVLLSFYKLSVE